MSFDSRTALHCTKAIERLYAREIAPTIVCAATDTQVRVEEISEGRFGILFPGTASIKDWLTDARISKVKWGKGAVHAGFAEAFRSVADQITDAILPGSRVIITGHSLGGALATLCADAFQDVFEIEGVFTFGSPRVGNARFVGEYNPGPGVRTWRIVNAHDPVAHVPFVFGTYRHVNTQVYLDHDHRAVIASPLRVALGEWMETVESTVSRPAVAAFNLASPHNIAAYRKKLETLAR